MTDRDTDASDRPLTDPLQSNTHVTVPDRLRQKIERRLPETDFGSVDEYVVFVLDSVLREIDEDDADGDDEPVGDVSESAVSGDEAVQERLESLGYL